MLAALLLAACALDASGLEEEVFYPPDMDGPVCSPARQDVECGCSECISWDPDPTVTGYQVERKTISSGATVLIDLPMVIDVDPVTQETTNTLPTSWCVAKAGDPFPHEGVPYELRVRACRGFTNCGDWSDPIRYRGAPYWCGTENGEEQCYVADPVVSR